MHVVLAGGSGFLGKHLTRTLLQAGHDATIISRTTGSRHTSDPRVAYVTWDSLTTMGLPKNTECVIQLTGQPILKIPRWTEEYKKQVISSRVSSGLALVECLKQAHEARQRDSSSRAAVRFYIASSAVGIYQVNNETPYNEDGTIGSDFPAQVCKEVERVADLAQPYVEGGGSSGSGSGGGGGGAVVKMRTGIVLSKSGGALQRMWRPFQLGLGGTLGGGRQPFPWIHIEDMMGLYLHVLSSPLSGPLNCTAPAAPTTTNYDLTKALGKALRRPTLLPVPGFVLRAALGEEATLLLDGQRVYPDRALKAGYAFRFPQIEAALEDIRDSTLY